VVGVILNLALFFGYNVLWPEGFAGTFDWISALIAVAAGVALIVYQRNIIHVLAGCAVLGLLIKLIS
jgi:chromate transporter